MSHYTVEPAQYGTLKRPTMKCDFNFPRNIKPPFPNKNFTVIVAGTMGAGKTSAVVSWFEKQKRAADNIYYKIFSDIIWCAPPHARESIKECMLDGLKSDDIYDEICEEIFDKIRENRKRYGDANKSQLLIIDDQSTELKAYERPLKKIIQEHRHLHLSVILLTQYTIQVPRPIRVTCGMLIQFNASPSDIDLIASEFSTLPKRKLEAIAKFVFTGDSHDYMIINRATQEYYKGLQKITNIKR